MCEKRAWYIKWGERVGSSFIGVPRKYKRYKIIKVRYQILEMQTRTKNFTGWMAQIIQHEIDHCNGILI